MDFIIFYFYSFYTIITPSYDCIETIELARWLIQCGSDSERTGSVLLQRKESPFLYVCVRWEVHDPFLL